MNTSNKNYGIVRVRENRTCFICNDTIKKNEHCYTMNSRYGGRRWVCMDCFEELTSRQYDDYDWDDGRSSNGL